jgi:hypothetical protein
MINEGPKNGYAFVIDTDQYAGNFEREMTAYLTGRIGQCGVGDNMIEKLPIKFDNVTMLKDQYGTSRPTTCWFEPSIT